MFVHAVWRKHGGVIPRWQIMSDDALVHALAIPLVRVYALLETRVRVVDGCCRLDIWKQAKGEYFTGLWWGKRGV